MLWVRISIRAWCKTLCDKNCQWLVTGRWLSPGRPVSSTNITECHNITIKQINKRHLKFGHPSRFLSEIKYINICNVPPICHKVEHFEIFPFWPLLCQNSNGYMVMLYIFLKAISYEIIIIILIIICNIYIAHNLIKITNCRPKGSEFCWNGNGCCYSF